MRIITCVGYGGTGSSAITDLLSEFLNIKSLGEFEVTFLHYPDGIADLDYNITVNNRRLNTGYSIYKYEKFTKEIEKDYKKIFGKNFQKYTQEYIQEISTLFWKGYSELYRNERDSLEKFKYRIIKKITKKFNKEKNYYQNQNYPMYYSNKTKEEFNKITKNYLNNLFKQVKKNKDSDYLMVDQLLPSSNIREYIKYFDDLKVIIIDRDPRDIYILNKEIWNEGWIPKEVEQYIHYYREIRREQKENSKNILYLRFEDLIYKYEETLNKILYFLDIKKEDHIFKKEYFNPEKSKQNTNLKYKYLKYSEDIKKIEINLKEYCYEENK